MIPFLSSLLVFLLSSVECVHYFCLQFKQVKQYLWNILLYMSLHETVETTYVEFVCKACQLLASGQPMWNFIPVCTVSKWINLWTMYAIPVKHVFHTCLHFGTWSSLLDICLPYLSALWYVKQPVDSVCHTCLYCWHVKHTVDYVCHTCLHCWHVKHTVDYVCHTCLHCWHVKQPVDSVCHTCLHCWHEAHCGLCLPYLSALLAREGHCELCLPYLSALLAREAACGPCLIYLFVLLSREAACGPCLPYLSSLLACEAAYVIVTCHACLHCWHVKQPMRNLSTIPDCCSTQSSLCDICLPCKPALLARSLCDICLPYLSA